MRHRLRRYVVIGCCLLVWIAAVLIIQFYTDSSYVPSVEHAPDSEPVLRGTTLVGQPIADSLMLRVLDRCRVPGAGVAVVYKGRIDWARGYGMKQEGENDPVDTLTLFQAASISKPVSALVTLCLVDRGQLSLDEDVFPTLQTWRLPRNSFNKDRAITIRHLLSHSAGFTMHGVPQYTPDTPLPSLVEILAGVPGTESEGLRSIAFPGTRYQYSGGGYILLQVLIEERLGSDFASLADELVLAPTGMVESSFAQPLPPSFHHRAARAHHKDGAAYQHRWHVLPELAAGGLWTTPSDLARFMIAVFQAYHGLPDSVIPQPLAREMLTRQVDDMGLGLALPSAGVPRFHHGGGNDGYRCFMVMSIEGGDGVVIMCNGDNGDLLIDAIFHEVAHAYGWNV